MNKRFTVKRITLIGLMATLVLLTSWISIDIVANTRLHVGNVLCLLSGFILGPLGGGLAAGIGSFLFDILNPKYIDSAPYTLVFKFLMAYVCGKIAWSKGFKAENIKVNIIAGILGIIVYQILYLSKNFIYDYYLNRLTFEVAVGGLLYRLYTSLINGGIAVAVSVPLATSIKKALKKANINI